MHGFPMAVGSILKESVVVYVRNWRPFTVMSLASLPSLAILLALVPLLVLGLGFLTLPAVGWFPAWLEVVIVLGLVTVILVVGMLPYILAKATVVMAVSQYYVEEKVAIWPCFKLAMRNVVSLTLSSIAVGFVACLTFFVFAFAISYPFAHVFAGPLDSLFGDDFWFELGWLIPFWLSLLLSALIVWLFFVEGNMFTYEYSGDWRRSAGPDRSGGPSRTDLRMKTLAIGSVYTCGTVAVWCGVIIGAVVLFAFAVTYYLDDPISWKIVILFIGVLPVFMAALVVTTPVAWIGRTLAYFDLMKSQYGRELDLIRDDSGAFRWAIRRRLE